LLKKTSSPVPSHRFRLNCECKKISSLKESTLLLTTQSKHLTQNSQFPVSCTQSVESAAFHTQSDCIF
jgi:hypothetical protein